MRHQGVPPHWMPYIESNNVDETARLAASLGATVMVPPRDIPNVGRFALIQDPQGAVFGTYKANGPSRAWNGTPELGRFSWHELMTSDYQQAFDFYRKLFGWEKTGEMDMGPGNKYLMYGKGQPFGGIFNRHGDMANMRPFWLVYIFVKDVKKAVDVATKNGAFVQRPPMEVPGGGTIAILGDPQGAAFALHSSQTAASKPAAKKSSGTKTRSAVKKSARPAKRSAAKKSRGASTKRVATKARGAAKKRGASTKRAATKKRGATKKRATAKKATRRRR
jgi:hypothetical protein